MTQELKRYAFLLWLRAGAEAAYDEAHRAVWPEMLALLKRAGIHEYSIYRRNRMLILTLRCQDFEATWRQIEHDPVNLRWQLAMAPLFEPTDSRESSLPDAQPSDARLPDPARPTERFAMLDEVFYLA